MNAALEDTVPMTGVEVNVFMCRQCLRAGSWPYGIVVAQQAMMGVGVGNRAWQELVTVTLTVQGINRALFDADVAKTWQLLNGG